MVGVGGGVAGEPAGVPAGGGGLEETKAAPSDAGGSGGAATTGECGTHSPGVCVCTHMRACTRVCVHPAWVPVCLCARVPVCLHACVPVCVKCGSLTPVSGVLRGL